MHDRKVATPSRSPPMQLIRRLPFTFALGLVSLAIVVAVLGFDLELVHVQFLVPAQGQVTRVDDLLAAAALFVAGLLIDRGLAARRAAEIQAQRLRVLKATMRTVHDIVGNFLNGLQLVRLEADDSLPPDVVDLLERLTDETAGKLKALGDLESVPEKQLPVGVVIDYEGARAVKS
jgi:hypothetical protein